MENNYFHTVFLDADKCKGCVTCMKRCPTEAIRVRNGKASVFYDRCIGCGECVRLCPSHAKLASYDSFDTINDFKYKIALPAPSLYGQFNNLTDVNYVLNGLLALGFDEVFEVGRGAEYASAVTKIIFDQNKVKYPVISTACPAVLELILSRYHNLKDNLLNILAPVDISAKLARDKAIKRGIPPEDIGVYFISPCPAKVYALKLGVGVSKPYVDRVLSTGEVYMKLVPAMNKLEPSDIKPLSKMGNLGLHWATSGGEATATFRSKYLAADGIENVKHILDGLEDNTLTEVDFIELDACAGGCVGGVLNVENPFVAKARIRQLRMKLPATSSNILADEGKPLSYYVWEDEPQFKNFDKLDENRLSAMQKLMEVENLLNTLPQYDCGMCGAPSCRAFAEDVVSGIVSDECPRLEKEVKNETE